MATGDLCTIQDMKEWTGVDGSADDRMLARLITAASSVIYSYLNRDRLSVADYVETYSGSGTATLVVKNFPVNSVASLSQNGVVIAQSMDKVQPGFFINDEGTAIKLTQQFYVAGPILAPNAAPFKFFRDSTVDISYNAGFAQIPDAITQVCIEIAARNYWGRKRQFKRSESLAGQNTSYITDALTDPQKLALANYRRFIPV